MDTIIEYNLGAAICARIDELAAITETPGRLTRTFLSPEQRRASALVMSWMHAAGMAAGLDAIGNVLGRYEGSQPDLPALMLGSHLDTVVDAGRYDGMLGVLTAISCIAAFHEAGRRFPFAIEVIGFGDEEGVRFGTTMLGSRAVAGIFDPAFLARVDKHGTSLAQALGDFGLDSKRIAAAARRPEDILSFVELHIEQGPVLEARGLPVGCVTAIAGATRLEVEVTGEAGHAGTVPMRSRRDAATAAAECILLVERRCGAESGLVGTVGCVSVEPGAINVIPGRVRFTIDTRAPDDRRREACVADLMRQIAEVAARRGVSVTARRIHDLAAAPCASWLMEQIDRAILASGVTPFRLASGAGHDAMAMNAIADIGMIFIRCRGGISHSPAESISVEDAEMGARVLARFIENFAPAGKR